MVNLGSSDSEPLTVDWQWYHHLPGLTPLILIVVVLLGIWHLFRRKSY